MSANDPYHIPNPLYELLIHLRENDEQKLDDPELVMLLKNCRTSFFKLVESVNQIAVIQEEPELLERLPLLKIQGIEYCFLKISTTWDIAYQIGEKLAGETKGKKKKYEELEKEFETYAKHLPNLRLDWYREVNKLRNKVVHGGINVVAYHENDALSFQAYDNDVDEMVRMSPFYCVRDRPLIYAEKYFSFYCALVYNYLKDFFLYVLIRLTGDSNPILAISEDPFDISDMFKSWTINGLERLNAVFDEMRRNWAGEELPFGNIEGESFYA